MEQVWNEHRDAKLRLADAAIEKLVFSAPCGAAPQDFLQVEISLYKWHIDQYLFSQNAWMRPNSYNDLVDGNCAGERLPTPVAFGKSSYKFESLTNVGLHVNQLKMLDKEHKERMNKRILTVTQQERENKYVTYAEMFPNALTQQPPAVRIFEEWAQSSAGLGGHIFCDHWFADMGEWRDARGNLYLSFIPQWTTSKMPPKVEQKPKTSLYALWDKLLAFDAKAGYNFAWYFFMLHGNRINDDVGHAVLRGAEQGLIVLPEHDYRVLKHWCDCSYGF